jgi:hypothetical protein
MGARGRPLDPDQIRPDAVPLQRVPAEVVEMHLPEMWQPISTAPFDRDLELAVIDQEGPHTLVFPCRRVLHGWISAHTRLQIEVRPTHWREWDKQSAA